MQIFAFRKINDTKQRLLIPAEDQKTAEKILKVYLRNLNKDYEDYFTDICGLVGPGVYSLYIAQ